MKSAFAPVTMTRSARFYRVCASSQKSTPFFRAVERGNARFYWVCASSQTGANQLEQSRFAPVRQLLHSFLGGSNWSGANTAPRCGTRWSGSRPLRDTPRRCVTARLTSCEVTHEP
jgi:hypothetical protein